jgi:hypothetical protein
MAKLSALHLDTNKKRNKGFLEKSPIRKVLITEKVSFIYHHLNVDGLQYRHEWKGVP